jgi:hypothetical protein
MCDANYYSNDGLKCKPCFGGKTSPPGSPKCYDIDNMLQNVRSLSEQQGGIIKTLAVSNAKSEEVKEKAKSDVLREFRVFFRRFVFWISLTTRWIHIDDIERDGDFEVHRFILHRVLRHGFGRRKRALCGRDILRRRVDPSPVIHHHLLFLAPPRDDGVFRRGAD